MASTSEGGREVVIADTGNHRVLRLSSNGQQITQIAGTGQPGDALNQNDPAATQLNKPAGVAVTDAEEVVIADTGNNRVLLVRRYGKVVSKVDKTVAKVRDELTTQNFDAVNKAQEELRGQLWMFNLLTTCRFGVDSVGKPNGGALARFFRTHSVASSLDPAVFKRISDYVYQPNRGDFVI